LGKGEYFFIKNVHQPAQGIVCCDEPWQTPLNKAPKQGGKEEQRERTPSPSQKRKTQSGSQRGAKEQNCELCKIINLGKK
jgi:hypothetical protein